MQPVKSPDGFFSPFSVVSEARLEVAETPASEATSTDQAPDPVPQQEDALTNAGHIPQKVLQAWRKQFQNEAEKKAAEK